MALDNNVVWISSGKILDKVKFEEVMKQVTTQSQAEYETLTHEWYISEDGEEYFIRECPIFCV